MPKMFLETAHHLTDQLGACTEFKRQGASNLDLNTLTFSDYKNTTAAKVYVGIVPQGGVFVLVTYEVIPGNLQKYISTNRNLLHCKPLPAHFSNNAVVCRQADQ